MIPVVTPSASAIPSNKDIDILGVCHIDYANTAARFTKCLRHLGYNTRSYCGQRLSLGKADPKYPYLVTISDSLSNLTNNFPYTVTVNSKNKSSLQNLIYRSKVVWFFGTTFVNGVDFPKDIKYIVQHGGITYRNNPAASNAVFNPIVDATVIQCPDLLNLGAKNEHLIYYPIDTDHITPSIKFINDKTLYIGHFPSSQINKGSASIYNVIQRLSKIGNKFKNKFVYNGIIPHSKITVANRYSHITTWQSNLNRQSTSDVIIETCSPLCQGKKFAEWGNTALECAAAGKIVVTNTLTKTLYEKEYTTDYPLFLNDGTEDGLESNLIEILNMDRDELFERKKQTMEWAHKHHSISATAKRIEKKLSTILPKS